MRKSTLVTCATGDIGQFLCRYLAKHRHDLVLTARDEAKLQGLKDSIQADYPECEISIFPADLSNPASMIPLVSYVTKTELDGIVIMPPRPPQLPKDPLVQYDVLSQAMNDCFISPRLLLQQLLPSLARSKYKSVVLVSGASSKQAISCASYEAYNDVRMAWNACMKTFADVHGPKGIHFNTVSPGQVMTPSYSSKLEEEANVKSTFLTDVLAERTATVPLRQLASLKGIARAVNFFLTKAKEITAANTLIDGGAARLY